MTDSTTQRSSAYSATNVPSGWDEVPCVQYGFPEDKGPIRLPKLTTVFEPIPEEANTASPVYLLTPEEYERQSEFESGYEVSGTSTIGKELQDSCEDNDRVLYPIHIESDVYHEEDAQTLIEWFREFTDDWLGVPFHDCSCYFSGNRSIHVHVPRFVHGEEQRERLKERAETFSEEVGADLDVGLYSAKRLFRLPGVPHESSTLPKVEIQPEWGHDRIISEGTTTTTNRPASYAEVLRDVFALRGGVTQEMDPIPMDDPHDLFAKVLDMSTAVLAFESDEQEIKTPLVEQVECPKHSVDVPKWAMYNSKEFSPYAFGTGNPRSVAALCVKGGPFARQDKRNGATMVPAYFFGAVGCDSGFTKEREHAPLQLSKQDYKKWDATPGDSIVIIGGQSRNSRIYHVKRWQAQAVGHDLTGEGASREAALDYLTEQGYDVGSVGSTRSTSSSGGNQQRESKHIWSARSNPRTQAEHLQRQAEQNGIETLTHIERAQVACRHLKQGWQPTWEWFKEQYGSDFKPDVAWTNLRNLVEQYGYDVEIPEKPV